MIKIEKINAVELKPIYFSTVTVKDFASFVDNTNECYFLLGKKYLDKLYKSIDIGGYQFVKKLYTIDPTYCIDLVTRKLGSTQFNVYELPGHEYVLTSDQFIDSYTSILELLEDKFEVTYEELSSKKATQELLQYNTNTGSGIYFNFDFKNETVDVYRVNVINTSYLALDRIGSFKMTDPATVAYVKDEINSARTICTSDTIDNISLTWSEVKKLCKVYKLDKELFMDSTVESVLKDKEIDLDTNASSTTSVDFAKSLFEHINDISNLSYFYDRLIRQNYYFSNT